MENDFSKTAQEKQISENREQVRIDKKYEKIIAPSSKIFYASIVLFNILTLVIAVLYLNSKQTVEDIRIVFEAFDYKLLILLTVIFLSIILIKALPIFLKIFAKTKSKKFGRVLGATITQEYFGCVTVYGNAKNSSAIKYLEKSQVDDVTAIDVVYGANVLDKLSYILYAIVIMFIGILGFASNVNVWLIVIASLALALNIVIVLIVLLFENHKKGVINIVSKTVKLLYRLKLIKDYEALYNKIIDKLIINAKGIKQDGWITFTEIFAGLLRNFLKGAILYFVIVTLNIADGNVIFDILFRCLILDLILKSLPLQSGTLIFEILFIALFRSLFFSGYVFWALLIYRFFDLFAYVIAYLISLMCNAIRNKKVIKQ